MCGCHLPVVAGVSLAWKRFGVFVWNLRTCSATDLNGELADAEASDGARVRMRESDANENGTGSVKPRALWDSWICLTTWLFLVVLRVVMLWVREDGTAVRGACCADAAAPAVAGRERVLEAKWNSTGSVSGFSEWTRELLAIGWTRRAFSFVSLACFLRRSNSARSVSIFAISASIDEMAVTLRFLLSEANLGDLGSVRAGAAMEGLMLSVLGLAPALFFLLVLAVDATETLEMSRSWMDGAGFFAFCFAAVARMNPFSAIGLVTATFAPLLVFVRFLSLLLMLLTEMSVAAVVLSSARMRLPSSCFLAENTRVFLTPVKSTGSSRVSRSTVLSSSAACSFLAELRVTGLEKNASAWAASSCDGSEKSKKCGAENSKVGSILLLWLVQREK
eukprot:comp10170_c1_seq1/m.12132 comp10170_c1_seq1/g.12132  ORF comp10170_c1_seq1/g.12132 comp10170_c1_seq1/m.12132 type:complete len:392 (+) comp10170_c1_seq1:1282-2457(+)